LEDDDLMALLVEMLAASGGPLGAAERRAADRTLGRRSKQPRLRLVIRGVLNR
jgi:hypothetical protein